jgi:hypothetical protein
LAGRATWNSAAAGAICGSRPVADVVTRSTGEILAHQRGADDLAILLDEAAGGLAREQHLGNDVEDGHREGPDPDGDHEKC